ncbi:DMSO/selenate family reductase complex A subunit [Ferrimonas marina]|uniref:Anaerobic dimethyl sulfoxide reductase subunit A n=1 Tax=Ferrimonas marina TaxID=299255 RepID=A0A1M5VGH3_9GAMM|nr:DMSO/selenate family reductase complex A subunit [Ferrimonas marina]SHH74349.1 anaerobic dimethyl sulfoxide reductase subunit A [Ferrimonas marina]
MQRRDFLKMSAALGGAAALAGCQRPEATAEPLSEEQVNWSACLVNCGSNCPLKVYSRDGMITRIETDHSFADEYGNHQVRACLRGRSVRQRVYAPDRLKYPMKRTGPRGSGQFQRISWEEALDSIHAKLGHVIKEYGNESVFFTYNSGAYYNFGGKQNYYRLMNLLGGYLNSYGDYSWGQMYQAARYTFGSEALAYQGSAMAEMQAADLVLMLGYNPSEIRMSGSGEAYDFLVMKQQLGFKTIIVDPRYTDSALGKEDQWLPIRPGTDAALAEAIAYQLIQHHGVDQAFLDRYCQGYDERTLPKGVPFKASYKAHILDIEQPGDQPGANARTPEWAASITGIPAAQIRQLAQTLAQTAATGKVYVQIAASLNRHAAGENTIRAMYMLPLLLGQVGLPGTNTGALPSGSSLSAPVMPTGDNPVESAISFFTWTQAVLDGQNMTVQRDGVRLPEDKLDEQGDGRLGHDIKAIINYAGNALINQHADANRTAEILKDDSRCEFILVVDNWMTPSAEYADIILPDVTWLESEDLITQGYAAGNTGTLVQISSAIGPMFECRNSYDVCTELARRFGVEQAFTEGKSAQQWLDQFYAEAQAANPGLPDKSVMLKQGVYRQYLPNGSHIALQDFRDDPEANPLATPSGKIEIYSSELADKAARWQLPADQVISAIPQYCATAEGAEDRDGMRRYPLQLTGYHTKGRVHSSYHNVPWLREAVQDAVWISPMDAEARGLATGNRVQVFNDRGTIEVEVKVTPRIMPGVVALGQGAWYQGGDVDKGGCLNTLTSQRPTPLSKGNGQHTNLVEIRKIAETDA